MNNNSFSLTESRSSKESFGRADQLIAARDRYNQGKRQSFLMSLFFFFVGFVGLSIGLLVIALYRSDAAPAAQGQVSCQSLIDQALAYSGKYCNQIGANKGCYGNTTIQAKMIANASQRFSQRGDVADLTQIQSISASPMNLSTNDWGIVIFRVSANLPSTVPGEMVTLMVFGNTNLEKKSTGLDSFYFSSELGQIVCDKVPTDGVMINMPNGAGWTFEVNGTELTLMGNSSLTATKNGAMVVNLYSGSGQITSDSQTQYFGAGQSVSVNLGGPNGDNAVGPPSLPQPLSPETLKVACKMTGNYCGQNAIPTIDAPASPLPPSTTIPSLPPPTAFVSTPVPNTQVPNNPVPPANTPVPPPANTPVPPPANTPVPPPANTPVPPPANTPVPPPANTPVPPPANTPDCHGWHHWHDHCGGDGWHHHGP